MELDYLLYGYGIANKSVSKYFDTCGISYQIIDDKDKINIVDFDNIQYVVKSPGINNNTSLMRLFAYYNLNIVTDLELFYHFIKNKHIICVTGSNGKTTTVSLLEHLLKEEYIACGNIGNPIFNEIKNSKNYIIEASSYMLEYTKSFKPDIFVILNIEKHHLDHHGTFINYIKSKIKPLKNMSSEDIVIYNKDDLLLNRIVASYEHKHYSFSINNNKATCYLLNNIIYYNDLPRYNINDSCLLGKHNILNMMVSIIITSLLYKFDDNTKNKINNFLPLPHRLEIITLKNYPYTIFINDSKSTNPFSMKVAVDAVKSKYTDKKIILLVGGFLGKTDYHKINDILSNVDNVYSFGEIGPHICSLINFTTLNILLEHLKNINLDNCVILFSPGAQSYDEFSSFEERGNYFKNYLRRFFNK